MLALRTLPGEAGRSLKPQRSPACPPSDVQGKPDLILGSHGPLPLCGPVHDKARFVVAPSDPGR